jgi:hypothetical protein
MRLLGTALLVVSAGSAICSSPGFISANQDNIAFTVYDNMFYRGRPATAQENLAASNILYENVI